jgi:hypothetical protein
LRNQATLPADPLMVYSFIVHISILYGCSIGVRRTAVAISGFHLFNRFIDPIKDREVCIAMKRMHRTLGRSANKAYGIRQEMLNVFLANVGNSIGRLRDAALLQIASITPSSVVAS